MDFREALEKVTAEEPLYVESLGIELIFKRAPFGYIKRIEEALKKSAHQALWAMGSEYICDLDGEPIFSRERTVGIEAARVCPSNVSVELIRKFNEVNAPDAEKN